MPDPTFADNGDRAQITDDHDSRFKQRHRLSWLLDSSIPLPGGYRIGLDGLLGLIPGVGDLIGGGLSTLLLFQAWQNNVPKMVIARMVINILIDAAVGAIPILGDLFDFVWKANLRNARLLDNYQRNPHQVYRRSTAATLGFVVGVLLLVALVIFAVVSLIGALLTALG